MHARSALFDLYGDHLRTRDHQAPVAALVRLLAAVGIRAPAVRTAISRMVIQGWLAPVSLPEGPGYRATAQAIRRLDDAAARVYRLRAGRWDGTWHLVLPAPIPDRTRRRRLREELSWLGYAELCEGTWISPWASGELPDLLARTETSAATAVVSDFDPPDRPVQAWDLDALGAEYAAWLDAADHLAREATGAAEHDQDRADFAVRFRLVHEWRKFLFLDPGLPDELLPADWPGRAAARRFTEIATGLQPGTDRFVDRCLDCST